VPENEFRLDVSGLLRLRIQQIGKPMLEASWISGADHLDNLPTIDEISHLAIPMQGRILRLCEFLSNPRPGLGPWCARGIIAASSQGSTTFALGLIDAWLTRHWSPIQEARARAVTRSYWHRLRNGALQAREIAPNVLDCGDLPAPIIPSIIRQRNWLRESQEWMVLSGGDHLTSGNWVWHFDEAGIGTVLQQKVGRTRLLELSDEIGIHLNHPLVGGINGHLHRAR
jgi:hypothetical protein